MSTRGVLVLKINGRFYLFRSYSDSYPNYLGRIISQFMRWLKLKLRNVKLTRPDILNEFIREWRAKDGYNVSPLAEDYYTVEHCNTIDDVMKTYQQNVFCEYIYVLEYTEAGEFKVTFSNAFIKCTSEYTQDYVQLTQIEFERVVEHWSDLSKDDKWYNASIEDKRWLVATLDPQMRHMGACNIQKIWRGHHARWKCPCFSFNDTDGTVPLCKKQRTK